MFGKKRQYPVPNAYGLTPAEQVKLTSGADFWGTEAFPQAGIPRFRMSDGPHGLRFQAGTGDHLGINDSTPSTAFPTGSALACTWDPALVARMGAAIGQEARSLHVDMVLGPGVNIKRNPLCGRNFEYFSEDPFLAGKLAVGWIKGAQSAGVGACLKHYAVNNQENDRLRSDSLVDPSALHALYLEAFRIAVTEAQPEGVMCSYNLINGTYASDDTYLLSTVLRKQWGFRGAVITDWGALNDKTAALNAGTDLEMPGNKHLFDKQALRDLVSGRLQPAALTRAVAKIAQLAQKPRPAFTGDRDQLLRDNAQLAEQIEEQAAVLLKNDDHLLPLNATDKIAVIGQMAAATRFQGAGSSHINAAETVSITQGLNAAGIAYTYADGRDQKKAVAAAQAADKVVFVAGLPETAESEGFDRETMALPADQNALISAIAAVNPHIVVLLVAGAPVTLPWFDQVQGLLNLYLGGEHVGTAAARLLYGAVTPSGKLAETYPLRYADVPSSAIYDRNTLSVAYAESLYVGYRYYEKAQVPVRFPFGYGLSYTSFAVSDCHLSQATVKPGETIHVTATVRNTGDRTGAEVVQVYVGNDPDAALTPLKTLQGFAKVTLAPGAAKTVTIDLPAQAFSEWDDQAQQFVLPQGQKTVIVATSSAADAAAATLPVTLQGTSRARRLTAIPAWYRHPQGLPAVADFEKLSGRTVTPPHQPRPGEFSKYSTPKEMGQYSWVVRQITAIAKQQMIGTDHPTSAEDRFMETTIMNTPLIRLSQQSSGALPLAAVDRLVAAANRHYAGLITGRSR